MAKKRMLINPRAITFLDNAFAAIEKERKERERERKETPEIKKTRNLKKSGRDDDRCSNNANERGNGGFSDGEIAGRINHINELWRQRIINAFCGYGSKKLF